MKEFFEIAYRAFEVAAVIVLFIGSVICGGRYFQQILKTTDRNAAYRQLRTGFGRSLLVALDLLLIADIIVTVTLEFSYTSLATLGMLVAIRSFLHLFIEVEVSGHWPWQRWRVSDVKRHD